MREAEQATEQRSGAALERVGTGCAGLDVVLRGGFLEGGVYVVSGPPGAGKTVLGNQFAFHAVGAGQHAVFVTVLAESHGRMVAHLQNMTFFQPERVGQQLEYVSAYSVLRAEGLPGLQRLLQRLVRERGAGVLVLDGLAAVQELAGEKLAFREFLNALGVHNALAGCTTLLLTTEDGTRPADPEYAMVDGIVRLGTARAGLRSISTLEVTKFRGARQLTGQHLCDITGRGLEVFPRIEARYTQPPELIPDPDDRLGFGVKRLDEMLYGGFLRYSNTLLLGSPGAGKTVLGLHFLHAGAERGEPGLYYGFSEPPRQLLQKARMVGIDLERHARAGRVRLESRLSVETLPDQLADELFGLVEATGARRLFLDGMEPLAAEAVGDQRDPRFVAALLGELRRRGVTVLFSQQTNTLLGPELHAPLQGVEAIVDNILFVRFFELHSQLYRLLGVLKMRDSDQDPALREFRITSDGIDVAESFESAEAILTGQARPAPPGGGKRKRRRGLLGRKRRGTR